MSDGGFNPYPECLKSCLATGLEEFPGTIPMPIQAPRRTLELLPIKQWGAREATFYRHSTFQRPLARVSGGPAQETHMWDPTRWHTGLYREGVASGEKPPATATHHELRRTPFRARPHTHNRSGGRNIADNPRTDTDRGSHRRESPNYGATHSRPQHNRAKQSDQE